MNTDHLIYVIETYRCGSINQAAKNCFISQSSLSSIIKNIENEIGYILFHRTKSGLVATSAGEHFMISAERIISERKVIQKIPDSLPDGNDLTILCSRSSFILHCFFDFRNEFPCLSSHDVFLEAGSRENIKGMIDQQCRLGFLVLFESRISNYQEIARQYCLDFSVFKDNIPVHAFISKKHPLAKKEFIYSSDLANYPFVADAHIDPSDTLSIFGIHDKTQILFACDRGTTFDAVRKGLYISVGLKIPLSDAETLNIICRQIRNAEKMAICLIKSHYLQLNERETHFLEYLNGRLSDFFSDN